MPLQAGSDSTVALRTVCTRSQWFCQISLAIHHMEMRNLTFLSSSEYHPRWVLADTHFLSIQIVYWLVVVTRNLELCTRNLAVFKSVVQAQMRPIFGFLHGRWDLIGWAREAFVEQRKINHHHFGSSYPSDCLSWGKEKKSLTTTFLCNIWKSYMKKTNTKMTFVCVARSNPYDEFGFFYHNENN